ncbi:uncharacterized protein VP01_8387g1, partial [Puccinia sorghi]
AAAQLWCLLPWIKLIPTFPGRKNHTAHTPFGLMKVIFRDTSLPHHQKKNKKTKNKISSPICMVPCRNLLTNKPRNSMQLLETLLTDILKAKKHFTATIIKDSVIATKPVDKLSMLVDDLFSLMHPRFKDLSKEQININSMVTKAVKARLAYLRLVINLNRHQRLTDSKGPKFWHQIDNDLQDRMRQGRIYSFAFAQLILKKDRALWNGTNTVNTVSVDDHQPSHPRRN